MLYQSIYGNKSMSNVQKTLHMTKMSWNGGQKKGGGTHKFIIRHEPASVQTNQRIASPLHAKITDVSKGLFWCLSSLYWWLCSLLSLDYRFWRTLQLFCLRITGSTKQKFLVGTNLDAEKVEHLPSSHPF